ncbi:hypothetical protein BURMUCGD1_6531 [Burkholderia multivorans CGD1]|nr:hypothetical protein BURMUCGD1_6531 [Burkholderia multivorans CGD1]
MIRMALSPGYPTGRQGFGQDGASTLSQIHARPLPISGIRVRDEHVRYRFEKRIFAN